MALPNKNTARKPRSHSGWSPERRARQSAMMKSAQIWKKSTGPRTKKGKARSALNATKHGHRGREWRHYYALLARQRVYVRDVVAPNKINRLQNSARQNAANELLKQRLHFLDSPLIKRPMWTVAALYRFVEITDLPAVQAELKAACEENGICGTILIAPEGVNGTIAGIGEHNNIFNSTSFVGN